VTPFGTYWVHKLPGHRVRWGCICFSPILHVDSQNGRETNRPHNAVLYGELKNGGRLCNPAWVKIGEWRKEWCAMEYCLNRLTPKAIIVPHRIIRNWYTGRWWVGCYIWYSEERPGRPAAPPSPLLAVPNVTAHPSTASVPITVL